MNIGLICNDDIILAQLCILIKHELYYKWIIMAPFFKSKLQQNKQQWYL